MFSIHNSSCEMIKDTVCSSSVVSGAVVANSLSVNLQSVRHKTPLRYTGCTPLLQCLGQLSLLFSVGR